jgi:hypothetical protein
VDSAKTLTRHCLQRTFCDLLSILYRLWKSGLVKSWLFSRRSTLRLLPYYNQPQAGANIGSA